MISKYHDSFAFSTFFFFANDSILLLSYGVVLMSLSGEVAVVNVALVFLLFSLNLTALTWLNKTEPVPVLT